MTLRHVVVVGLLAALLLGVGCSPPKPQGACGGKICATSSERCDRDSLTCVPDLPPVVVLDAPVGVVSDASFVISGTVTDDDTVTLAEWRSGSNDWQPLDLDSAGAFRVTVAAPPFDAENFAVTVRARDRLQEASSSAAVRVDRVAPTLELVSPDAGTVVTAATFEVSVRASDGSGSLSSLTLGNSAVANPTNGGVFKAMVAVPATANLDAVELTAEAADSRGNRASTTFTFLGDRVGPALTVTSPTPNQQISGAQLTVSFTASDPAGLSAVHCSTTGSMQDATLTATGGSCVLTLVPGERMDQVRVVAVDTNGNATTVDVPFQLDNVPPGVTITAPQANVFANAAVPVTVVTTGGATQVSARFGTAGPVALAGGPSWSGTVPIPAHDYLPETLTVEARDAFGNVGTATVVVGVDTVPPVISFTAPTQNQKFNLAALAGGTDVTASWTVSDLDPNAHTINVNGAASAASSVMVATSSTDNPQSYVVTVIAADRAGNNTTAHVDFSVDRVAPTLVTWTPATGTRNLWPPSTTITFSEPVTSPSGNVVRLSTAAQPAFTAAGNGWSASLAAFALQAFDLSVASDATDAYGNPVTPLPAARRVHVGTGIGAGASLSFATQVTAFDAAADADGVLTIAAVSAGVLRVFRDTGVPNPSDPALGNFVEVPSLGANNVSRAQVSSWNVVNASLASSTRWGVAAQTPSGTARFWSIDGTTANDTLATPGALVTRPPLGIPPPAPVNVPWEGTVAPVGFVNDTQYSRAKTTGTGTWTLPASGRWTTLQSNGSWSVLSPTASAMQWVRFYCSYASGLGKYCEGILYTAGASSPSGEQGAYTRGGACEVVTWTSGGSRYGVFQSAPACESDGNPCFSTPFTASLLANDPRVATWDASGEDTLLFSRRAASAGTMELFKMTPGTCSYSGMVVASTNSLPGMLGTNYPSLHLPVRVGTTAALLYVDSGGQLRLKVP